MYTIKQAARLTGLPESTLRSWERRYRVVSPRRTESGYRLYDEETLAVMSTMRRLVDDGWAPATAARAIRDGTVSPVHEEAARESSSEIQQPAALTHRRQFLASAAEMDTVGIEESLDAGFALGSFEYVVDTWLFPTLEALGAGWARGDIDVAGEHTASQAVHRRLAAAFQAAGSRSRGAAVVVGLPPESHHLLGALAFATAIRRRGLNVLYLGGDVPVSSWDVAVRTHAARAAVLCVVSPEDRRTAKTVVQRLLANDTGPRLFAGGGSGENLAVGVHTLASTIGEAASELDELMHQPTV
jgi:DNA-binding transcriptional MerR regulator/methylmalonyl-CoA mutase cobalamin-binding subunit